MHLHHTEFDCKALLTTCMLQIHLDLFVSYLAAIKGEVIGSGNAILDVHSFLLIGLCQFVELHLIKCQDTREVINALYR